MTGLANTPDPPYYAVVFTSVRTPADADGYAAMADEMDRLARTMPGFLGVESARGPDGVGVTVSYWATAADVAGWRDHAAHRVAQRLGKEAWYAAFRLRVCRVERATGFDG